MSIGPTLLANIAGEEGAGWLALAETPRVRTLKALWCQLFEAPVALAQLTTGGDALVAWLNTEEAEARARESGLCLAGAPARQVARVHDKAFALATAETEGLVPEVLRGRLLSFDPETLADPDTGIRALETALATLPEWARASFTLKPRLGTSSRGRVAGTGGRADSEAIRGTLPRLAARGGAILEPWLQRRQDASAQLWIEPSGEVTLLGTLEQVVSGAGMLRGHRGDLDDRGRVRSGCAFDEALREAAICMARAAAAEGYHGPCGVDAFSFLCPVTGKVVLRPLVEFNARFTAGIVALGHLRRRLPGIRERLALNPGERRYFFLGLDAPPGGWPEAQHTSLFLPLQGDEIPQRPGLYVSADRSEMDQLC